MGNTGAGAPTPTGARHRRGLRSRASGVGVTLGVPPLSSPVSGYNKHALSLLERMFQDLAKRSPDETMSKQTFLEFFNLPGILGERLFRVFDQKGDGVIHFDEFVTGLSRYNHGSMSDKIHMLFQMYDLDEQDYITRDELSVVLYSLVTPTTALFSDRDGSGLVEENNGLSHVSEMTRQTVEALLESAFNEFDGNNTGTLSRDEFSRWIEQNPTVIETLQTVFAKHIWGGGANPPASTRVRHNSGSYNLEQKEIWPAPPRQATSRPGQQTNLLRILREKYEKDAVMSTNAYYSCEHCRFCFSESLRERDIESEYQSYTHFSIIRHHGVGRLRISHCPACGYELLSHVGRNDSLVGELSLQRAISATHEEQIRQSSTVLFSGMLIKIGTRMHQKVERWMVLKDKFLYTFKRQEDDAPSSCLFVSGWFIERIEEDDITRKHGLYGFEMLPPEDSSAAPKKFYCADGDELTRWISALQDAAQTIAIETRYTIGHVLGKGHFSVVHSGTQLSTGQNFAIKIVEKKRIDAREKEALRNEIAIMKLVRHPHIIRMQDVFEDKRCIYLVMPIVEHGDFFERWKKTKVYPEETAKIIVWRLLDAVHYLHALGIVHRDLKPENLLCLSATDDTQLVISDFGLSKFAAPHEEMMMPCGTLAYVAPEVLKMNGYNRKVDLWSIGCIMHLLLRGILPFDGHTKDEVIERTIKKPLNLTNPIWEKISDEAKQLLRALLQKEPDNRIGLNSALDHPWFESIRGQEEQQPGLRLSPSMKGISDIAALAASDQGEQERSVERSLSERSGHIDASGPTSI